LINYSVQVSGERGSEVESKQQQEVEGRPETEDEAMVGKEERRNPRDGARETLVLARLDVRAPARLPANQSSKESGNKSTYCKGSLETTKEGARAC